MRSEELAEAAGRAAESREVGPPFVAVVVAHGVGAGTATERAAADRRGASGEVPLPPRVPNGRGAISADGLRREAP
jgi:hypothetical protein